MDYRDRMYFSFDDLKEKSKYKPRGWTKEIMSKHEKNEFGPYLWLKDFQEIKTKYEGKVRLGYRVSSFFNHLYKNFVSFIKTRKIRVNIFTANKRYGICKMCLEFDQTKKRCKICGCYMQIKTKLIYAKCPLNKWD
jgi:hypothetical protein